MTKWAGLEFHSARRLPRHAPQHVAGRHYGRHPASAEDDVPLHVMSMLRALPHLQKLVQSHMGPVPPDLLFSSRCKCKPKVL